MKKGFTLIEMLVILVFISIIALMAIPSITNMIKKGEDDKYQVFLDDVFLATEAYIQKYKDDYPSLNFEGASTYIYMKDLVDEKLISTNLVNPKYCVDNECTSKRIATCTNTSCTVDDYTIIVKKDEDGKYKYELVNGIIEPCNEYNVGQEFLFDYTGTEQTFTPACSGNYKIELWGAQGGSSNTFFGGYGAYSVGTVALNSDSKLYINVGQSGKSITSGSAFSYNGGGYAKFYNDRIPSSGGGATHVATESGILSSLSKYVGNHNSPIIIVASGGGGSTYQSTDTCGYGGSGGGIKGNDGIPGTNCSYAINERRYGTGGSQTEGGTSLGCSAGFGETKGIFGMGASSSLSSIVYHMSGGGGGYYGGGADGCAGPGGGGSSYIANTSLIDKKMVCYNCATSNEVATKTESNTCHNSTPTADCSKEGNGYAKITYLGN